MMKTLITTQGNRILIQMSGRLQIEKQDNFRRELQAIVKNNAKVHAIAQEFIFDLKDLEFVGSSGISQFVQTLKEFNRQVANRPRYLMVRSEFKRIIRAFDQEMEFEFVEQLSDTAPAAGPIRDN